jgi:hypothetical protein
MTILILMTCACVFIASWVFVSNYFKKLERIEIKELNSEIEKIKQELKNHNEKMIFFDQKLREFRKELEDLSEASDEDQTSLLNLENIQKTNFEFLTEHCNNTSKKIDDIENIFREIANDSCKEHCQLRMYSTEKFIELEKEIEKLKKKQTKVKKEPKINKQKSKIITSKEDVAPGIK